MILNSHFNFFSAKFLPMMYMDTNSDWIYPTFLGRDIKDLCILIHSCWLISWVLFLFVLFYLEQCLSFKKNRFKIAYLDVINFPLWESRNENQDKRELWKTFCIMPALNFSSSLFAPTPQHRPSGQYDFPLCESLVPE